MAETKNNLETPIKNTSTHKDGISKWYTIFAVFLALNFCGLSYVYWVKFYKNKKTAANSNQSDSLLANLIILPNDTVYVDKDETDTLDEVSDEVDANQGTETVNNNLKVTSTDQNAQVAKTVSPVKADANENNKQLASATKKPSEKGIGKTEEESHSFLVSLGMFKSKANALSLIADLKQKGIEGEIIESDHFSKMAPGYILVLAGKELSSATAYQIGADMKKKGLEYFVKDAGKFSWR